MNARHPGILVWISLTACAGIPEAGDKAVLRHLPDQAMAHIVTGFAAPAETIVDTSEQWQRLWREMTKSQRPMPPLPEVDFTRDVVVVVALGRQRSGGFSVQILGADRTRSEVRVRYRVNTPGPDCMVSGAITSPVDIALLAKSAGSISFERESVVTPCVIGKAERLQ
jgi:PrcB C-terminal